MSNKNSNSINFDSFVAQFMGNYSEPFIYDNKQIKLFPLSIASDFIKAPIALFRANYNFLLLFLDGGGEQQVDSDVFELKANDVLFIREGHLNAIKSIHASTNGYFIYIDNAILSRIFSKKATLNCFSFNPKHAVSISDMKWLCQCCDLMLQNNNNNSTSSTEINVSLLKTIILKLAETWFPATSKPNRQTEITMLFKELLYENFIVRKDINFYANSLSVSENYLNRCVNEVTNKPPKQHIIELLISHSKLLLQDFSKDISQVAFELNFSDPSYFGRVFKQITKQTPTEYRYSVMQDLSE